MKPATFAFLFKGYGAADPKLEKNRALIRPLYRFQGTAKLAPKGDSTTANHHRQQKRAQNAMPHMVEKVSSTSKPKTRSKRGFRCGKPPYTATKNEPKTHRLAWPEKNQQGQPQNHLQNTDSESTTHEQKSQHPTWPEQRSNTAFLSRLKKKQKRQHCSTYHNRFHSPNRSPASLLGRAPGREGGRDFDPAVCALRHFLSSSRILVQVIYKFHSTVSFGLMVRVESCTSSYNVFLNT